MKIYAIINAILKMKPNDLCTNYLKKKDKKIMLEKQTMYATDRQSGFVLN